MQGQPKIIPLQEGFSVWTRRVGAAPVKLLLLHGGPGFNHEYFENFAERLPTDQVEIYFYDQLGSYFSDQPDDTSLWNIERFREEVEQVRSALGLEQFYLLGHSWGGLLSIEYALKYQRHLKGLVISNMTASIPAYVTYLNELRDRLPSDVIAAMRQYEERRDYGAPEYKKHLQTLYSKHVCRVDPWPEPVLRSFKHLNEQVYNTMQGDNEFVVTGTFKDWDRWDALSQLGIRTLLLVGRHDTMSVQDIKRMGDRIPDSSVHVCENGSHMSMWDDPDSYFAALNRFLLAS